MMRNATRISLCGWLLVAAFPLGGAASPGCRRSPLNTDDGRRGDHRGGRRRCGGLRAAAGAASRGRHRRRAGRLRGRFRCAVGRRRPAHLAADDERNAEHGPLSVRRRRGRGARQRRNHRHGGRQHRPAPTVSAAGRAAGSQHHGHQLPPARSDRGPRRELRARQFRVGHRVSDRHRRVRDARTSTSWRRERTGGSSRPTSSPGSRRSTPSCARRRRSRGTRSRSPSRKPPATRSARCWARRRCSGAGSSAIPRWPRPRPAFRSPMTSSRRSSRSS